MSPAANEYDAADPASAPTVGGGAYMCEEAEEELALVCTEKRCDTRGVVAILPFCLPLDLPGALVSCDVDRGRTLKCREPLKTEVERHKR